MQHEGDSQVSGGRGLEAIGRRRALHEEVVDRLRDYIIEGDIEPGDRLHEIGLSQRLQVSRTPLREAIKLLATEGLVDLLPGRGARVSALSPEAVGELFEVISGLERMAAELAAERMSDLEFSHIQELHDRMAAHFATGERHEYFALNHEIHGLIVAAAHNPTLVATHTGLMAKARRSRYTALASDARWAEAMGEHEALLAALRDRAARLAGDIMYRHDRKTGSTTVEMLIARPELQ